jgi:hypothetical protein
MWSMLLGGTEWNDKHCISQTRVPGGHVFE